MSINWIDHFFVLIDAINYFDCFNRINHINPENLNFSALKLKDNENDSTNSGMNIWGKKGKLFKITGIYWHLQRFSEVFLRNK